MATEKKFHTIHDISTGETVVREYTAEEYERDAQDNAAAAALEPHGTLRVRGQRDMTLVAADILY
jgi:hypothetical protein